MIQYLRGFGPQLMERFPLLQRLSSLGVKYVLVEALIEVPFLLIELLLWFGPLFGVTFGLSLWQRVLLVVLLYSLVEGGRFLFIAAIRKQPYQFLSAEWEVGKACIHWVIRLWRRGKGAWATFFTRLNSGSHVSE